MASTSAEQAGNSEASALVSSTNAANCAAEANASATSASGSASAAATSASNASTSETNAAASAVAAAGAEDDAIWYAIGEKPLGTPNEPPEGSAKYWATQAPGTGIVETVVAVAPIETTGTAQNISVNLEVGLAADLVTLTDGSLTSLHVHPDGGGGIVETVTATTPVTATGTAADRVIGLEAQTVTDLDTLTGGGETTLHSHAVSVDLTTLPGYEESGEAVAASDVTLANGNMFDKTIAANTTFTFTPGAFTRTGFSLQLTNGGDFTITWPATVKWAAGTAPTLTAGGIDLVNFMTLDGGTTWLGGVIGDLQ